MANGAAFDRRLARHRRGFLVILHSLAWAGSITAFTAFTFLRYLEAGGFSWAPLASTIAIATGLHLTIGMLLWIYEARSQVGSKDDALGFSRTVACTTASSRPLPFSSLAAR